MRLFNILKNLANSPYVEKWLTVTRTENNYVTQTAMNRIIAIKFGNLLVVEFNLEVTSNMPTGTGWIYIGQIDITGYKLNYDIMATVPAQSTAGTLLVQIQTDGTIRIYNSSTATIVGFCRANFAMPLTKLGGVVRRLLNACSVRGWAY